MVWLGISKIEYLFTRDDQSYRPSAGTGFWKYVDQEDSLSLCMIIAMRIGIDLDSYDDESTLFRNEVRKVKFPVIFMSIQEIRTSCRSLHDSISTSLVAFPDLSIVT